MFRRTLLAGALGLALCGAACSRVTIVTGTTLGLKVTPGDLNTRPPQVTLGYKRAETALVPTNGKTATRDPDGNDVNDVDAFSTVATFSLNTQWFGKTEVASFVATGHAARDIQDPGSRFNQAFAAATIPGGGMAPDLEARQDALADRVNQLTDDQATAVLKRAGFAVKTKKTAKQSLQDYVSEAGTDSALATFERSVDAVR